MKIQHAEILFDVQTRALSRRQQNGHATAADSRSSARWHATTTAFRARPEIVKIQTCKKCRAATRLVTIRCQFYLLATKVGAAYVIVELF